jgi:C4-dicarboxylate transporter, DctM subunit
MDQTLIETLLFLVAIIAVIGVAKLIGILDRLEEVLIGSLIAVATMLIFFAVIHRYGTGVSINISKWATAQGMDWLAAPTMATFKFFSGIDMSWSQELCIIMFVWMAKFGAAYGVRTGAHVGVDVALNALTSPSKYRVIVFGMMCGALFTAIIAAFGARFVVHTYHNGTMTNDLEAPMWIVFLAIPLGSALMSYRFMQVARSFSRTGELPHADEGHVEGLEKVVPGSATHPQGAH